MFGHTQSCGDWFLLLYIRLSQVIEAPPCSTTSPEIIKTAHFLI